jgi:hypothetical protein
VRRAESPRISRGKVFVFFGLLAPQVGLEPTTLRLTAECSAIELLRSVGVELSTTKVAESGGRVKNLGSGARGLWGHFPGTE